MSGYDVRDEEMDVIQDGERRKLLKCMAMASAGVLWTMKGGVLSAKTLDGIASVADSDFSFVQISDTHVGFHQAANPDVMATLQSAIAHVGSLGRTPSFVLHTGDVTHLAKPEQFDAAQQAFKGIKTDS